MLYCLAKTKLAAVLLEDSCVFLRLKMLMVCCCLRTTPDLGFFWCNPLVDIFDIKLHVWDGKMILVRLYLIWWMNGVQTSHPSILPLSAMLNWGVAGVFYIY